MIEDNDRKRAALQAAEDAVQAGASQALPGRNDALPPGALDPKRPKVQGDEHRDVSQAPVKPPGYDSNNETVADHLRAEAARATPKP